MARRKLWHGERTYHKVTDARVLAKDLRNEICDNGTMICQHCKKYPWLAFPAITRLRELTFEYHDAVEDMH